MVTFHLVYIGLAVPLTVWLALTLFRNGQLFLAEGTVKNYVSSAMQKLSVRDRTQAALRAKELGLL